MEIKHRALTFGKYTYINTYIDIYIYMYCIGPAIDDGCKLCFLFCVHCASVSEEARAAGGAVPSVPQSDARRFAVGQKVKKKFPG